MTTHTFPALDTNNTFSGKETFTLPAYFKAGPVVDIRAFGAACDGSTNDLAAFRAAIAALTPGGGTIVGAGKTYLSTSTGTEALLITAPIALHPAGDAQWTLMFNVPNTINWVRVAPALGTTPITSFGGSAYYFHGITWRDIIMVGASAANTAAGVGLHSLVLDPTSNDLFGFNLDNVHIFGGSASNGYGVYMNNTASANGGWYTSSVSNCTIWNGIHLYHSGDSLVFVDNKIRGYNDGIFISSISGAAGNRIQGNNITSVGSPIVIDGAVKPLIFNNEIGIDHFITPSTASATIWLKASDQVVYDAVIAGNYIGVDQINNPAFPNLLIGASAWRTTVQSNTFRPSTGQVAISNAGFGTYISTDNYQIDPTTGIQFLSTPSGSLSENDLPMLQGIVGFGQHENRLLWSEDITNAAWLKTSGGVALAPTVTQVSTTLPDGTTGNASRLQLSLNGGTTSSDLSFVQQAVTSLANPHVAVSSVWLKTNNPGTSYKVEVANWTQGAGEQITVGDNWVRVFVGKPQIVSSTQDQFRILLVGTGGYPNTADILAWGAQVSSNKIPYTKTEATSRALSYGVSGRNILGDLYVAGNKIVDSSGVGTFIGGISSNGKLVTDVNGLVTKYNNTTTTGQGLSAILGATSQKAETAADTNVLTYTPPASTGTYRVRFTLSLSAATAATLGWTMTWKDSNGAAQTPTNLSLYQAGTAAPALTFTTSAVGNYYADATIDVDNSATAIVVKLTFSGTSFAGKASAIIERLN